MNIKVHCYPKSIIYTSSVSIFKLRFTLCYRNVEEVMKMCSVQVGHAANPALVCKFTPFIESQTKR